MRSSGAQMYEEYDAVMGRSPSSPGACPFVPATPKPTRSALGIVGTG